MVFRSTLLPPDSTRVAISSAPPLAEPAARVMVAVGDPALRERVARVAQGFGLDTLTLEDPADVVDASAEENPDLILLEAERGGVELCGDLRAGGTKYASIILVSVQPPSQHEIACGLLAGADDFLAPMHREFELEARIRVQLRHKRQLDTLQRLRSERDRLRRAAEVDPLTRLQNRRSLEASLAERWENQDPFAVLFVDVDHFKRVNDSWGHSVGDEVLRLVAGALRQGVRPGDTVGRYGGEEFVIFVGGAGQEAARIISERLRREIQALTMPEPGPANVTVSIGVAVHDPRHAPDAGPHQLMQRADAALYEAKRSGRNRVLVARPPRSYGAPGLLPVHEPSPNSSLERRS